MSVTRPEIPPFFLPNIEATAGFAQILARRLCVGDVVLLKGALGAGKTALACAIIQAISIGKPEVTSPTYVIMQSYDVALQNQSITCWHIDLYRLDSPDDLIELGIDEILLAGLLLIEWPERLGNALPHDYILCDLTFSPNDDGRVVSLSFAGQCAARKESLCAALSPFTII